MHLVDLLVSCTLAFEQLLQKRMFIKHLFPDDVMLACFVVVLVLCVKLAIVLGLQRFEDISCMLETFLL